MALAKCVGRKEVARRAGVSAPVVSYVLNGSAKKHRISEATIKRVLRTARQMNYRPNISGRVLKTQRSHLLLFVSQGLTDPNTGEIIKAVTQVARSRGYSLLLLDLLGQENISDKAFWSVEAQMAEGVFVHTPSGPSDLYRDGSLVDKPVVLMGRESESPEISSVEVDNARGVALGVAHLRELGVKRIGVIAGYHEYPFHQRRLEALGSALIASGLSERDVDVFSWSRRAPFDAGVAAIEQWHASDALPDGIFALGDIKALGALSTLYRLGVPIPDRVKVVGFDGTPLSAYASPALTTVRQPFEGMAEAAMDILEENMAAPRRGMGVQRLIEPKLVVRASTVGWEEAKAARRAERETRSALP